MSEVASPDPWALLRPATPAKGGAGPCGQLAADGRAARPPRRPPAGARRCSRTSTRMRSWPTWRRAECRPCWPRPWPPTGPSNLLQPDRGRQLTASSRSDLAALQQEPPWDVVLIISDGLSPEAATHHGAEVAAALLAGLPGHILAAPVIVAPRGRVGLVSDVGSATGARLAVILLGERPGLSAIDGLSAYLEYDPGPGAPTRTGSISNIRPAGGLAPVEAGRAGRARHRQPGAAAERHRPQGRARGRPSVVGPLQHRHVVALGLADVDLAGRPILVAGSEIISRHWAIQPGSRRGRTAL